VLNGCAQGFSVTPEVRARILRAVEQSGYRANPFVRSLRTKRTMMVAWLDYKFETHGETGLDESALQWLVHDLAAEGYAVSCNFLSEEEPEQYFPQWPVDGVAIADVADATRLDRLTAAGIPFVIVNGIAGPGGCSVVVDEAQCNRLLYEHLLAVGHRRIAYYNKQRVGRLGRHYSVGERHEAYVRHVRDAGAEPLPEHDRHDIPVDEFVRATVLTAQATAVVAYDHLHALRLIGAVQRLGLRIPSDVSVVCFNDLFPMAEVVPSVTCVATPGEGLGRAAATLLLAQMRGAAVEERVIRVPGALTLRESVCPPRR
jgi:LacI family transcriptional regulator